MKNDHEHMRILEMIDRGEIDASEGLRLLQISNIDTWMGQDVSYMDRSGGIAGSQNLAAGETIEPADRSAGPEEYPAVSVPLPPSIEKMRLYWMIPLWIGAGITMLGGFFMYWALQAAGISFWLFLASLLFFLGVLVMALAWQSRDGHWLHLRIEQSPEEWPRKIVISLPLPVRLTAWFLRTFGDWIPAFQETALDEVILALDNTTTTENPIYIEIDDDEDGERVLIFIT